MNDQPKQPEQKEKSARLKQIEERKAKMATFAPQRETRVRVNPKSDEVRKLIKHPSGMAFPASGAADWPLDSFTKRRLREGSVTREDDKGKQGRQPTPPKPAA